MALDISATGARIAIKRNDSSENYIITQFSDEGTPFDAPDIDVSTNQKNLNGQMISSRTPSVYPFSITVIPGSDDDKKLTEWLRENALQPTSEGAIANTWGSAAGHYFTITVEIPAVVSSGTKGMMQYARQYTYTNCRMKSGPTGPSTSADGRMSARTFTFEAEGLSFGIA